jgi:type 1 glutamine amidotransferase
MSETTYRVLVFTRTTRYRHESIPAGIAAVQKLGAAYGFEVDATEDPATFTVDNLARYAAVVFLSTSGDVFDDAQRAAFTAYIRAGAGYLGIHLAAGTEYDWDFYGGLVGARFADHPQIQQATVRVEVPEHPATAHLPRERVWVDELYNYRSNPRGDVQVLMSLDESSYSGGTMGADHPITWCHDYQGGRAFYTGLGHTAESYDDPDFLALLLAAICYAADR